MEAIGKALLAFAVIAVTALGSMVTALFSLEFEPLLPSSSNVGPWRIVTEASAPEAGVRDRIAISNALFGAAAIPTSAIYHREVTETGAPLMRGCAYRVRGRVASSQWWVLEFHAQPSRRSDPELLQAFYSRDALAISGGLLDLAVPKAAASRPRSAGSARDPVFVVLRIYGLSAQSETPLRKENLPTIAAEPSCP